MKKLLILTAILIGVDVLYWVYERSELNLNNASNIEGASEMIKTRRRNRLFFLGINIFALGVGVKGVKEEVAILLMLIGAVMAFIWRP